MQLDHSAGHAFYSMTLPSYMATLTSLCHALEFEFTSYILAHSDTIQCIPIDYTLLPTKEACVCRLKNDMDEVEGACVTRCHPANVSQPTMTHPPLNMSLSHTFSYILIHSHVLSGILMHLIHSHTSCFQINKNVYVVLRLTWRRDGGMCHPRPLV